MRTLAVLIALGFTAAYGDDDKNKKDMALLDGEWTMVSSMNNGKEIPEEDLKTAKRTNKDGVSTIEIDGEVRMKAKFTIDASAKTKTINYEFLEGQNEGKKAEGIYEIDGDTVKFCFALPGGDRPTKFEAKEGSKHVMSVWKKAKKDK